MTQTSHRLHGLFTSESVTEGHPDKVADQIADAILDAHLAQDPLARVACEVVVMPRKVLLFGEITSQASVDQDAIVRDVLTDIGYTDDPLFCADTVVVDSHLQPQAHGIAIGVDSGGAGDQGIMFGYACMDTPALMPAPIAWAHALAKQLTAVRKTGSISYLKPDGKTQVTVEYDNGRPCRIAAIVVSTQHAAGVTQAQIREDVITHVITPVLAPLDMLDDTTEIFINPTGVFIVGGPAADSGLTGRKIIVDTYGGMARHGGGAFSGKDPTKVDRSAAYILRHIAKSLVAEGMAERLELQIAYAIGKVEPVSLHIETFGTGYVADDEILAKITGRYPLTPEGIIDYLSLRRPQYRPVAAYGHMGRVDLNPTWEQHALQDSIAGQPAGSSAMTIQEEVHV